VTNPHEIKGVPLHDQEDGVRCAISRNRIIGPIFFDDTIISERYCEVVLYLFTGHLNEEEIARSYFQQAGAATHTARVSMTLLSSVRGQNNFEGHLAARFRPILHPLIIICGGAIKGAV
jgi:hypothetical protein